MSFLSLKERETEGSRKRKERGRKGVCVCAYAHACVHPHPCGLEPVSTFAEPIIKFSSLVVDVSD